MTVFGKRCLIVLPPSTPTPTPTHLFNIIFTSFGRAVTNGLAELCTATLDPLQVSAHSRSRLVTEQNKVTSAVPIAGLD